MHPHFFYNALSSIREIVLTDPEYAADLLYDFTTYLRANIRAMVTDELIPFSSDETASETETEKTKKKKPSETPDEPDHRNHDDRPETGDEAHTVHWLFLLLCSAAALTAALLALVKERK